MSDSSSAGADEHIINRWSFDFYVSRAFSAFRNGDYAAFTHFVHIIESLAVRPIDGREDTVVRLRFVQFLSRINNGDKLDLTFEEPKTPLESALDVLESICRLMSVPPQEHELVRAAIAEMLVTVCIRSGDFQKAEEMLRHFSTTAHSAGKKKLLQQLIRGRRSSHSVLQLSSYSDFKQDMLDFIERLHCCPEPFLLTMLKRSGRPGVTTEPMTSSQDRQKPQNGTAAEDHGGPSLCLSLQSLRQVYGVLSEHYGVELPFSQLQRDVEAESQELHLTLAETPMELDEKAAQDDRPDMERRESRYAGMTMSRLVLEDDSQLSEDETQICPTSPKHRAVVSSDSESDDADLQTCPSSPMSPRRPNTDTHQTLRASGLEDQRSPAQCSTPARQTTTTETHNHHSASEAEVQTSSIQIPISPRPVRQTRTPRRNVASSDSEEQSASPALRRTVRRTQQREHSVSEPEVHRTSPQTQTRSRSSPTNTSSTGSPTHKRNVASSDSEEQSASPALRRTDRRTQKREHSVSEPEVHRTSPRAQTHRRSSPTHTSSTGAPRHKRSRWQDVSGTHENWSDEESLFGANSGPANKKSFRKKWTVQESEWLKEGVQRFGAGHWEQIRTSFPFEGRTAVNLKDRWRTMVKLGLT